MRRCGLGDNMESKGEAKRSDVERVRAERKALLRYVEDQFPDQREFVQGSYSDLKNVTVILGSARGGTSAVKEAVSKLSSKILAMPGEHRTAFTLEGLNFPDHGQLTESLEDGQPLSGEKRQSILQDIFHQCVGDLDTSPSPRALDLFAYRWAMQFRLQVPDMSIDLETILSAIKGAARREGEWNLHGATRVTLKALQTLRDLGIPVDPCAYAVDLADIQKVFPAAKPNYDSPALPHLPIIEISPFLVLAPMVVPPPPGPAEQLVLKASSDAFRIPLVKDLFSGFRTKYIHIRRNPAAAVNGLLDGWAHHCFWQHDLRQVIGERGRPYWKFDLFPGWSDLVAAPLPIVALSQWSHAQRNIASALTEEDNVLEVHFEHFLEGGSRRRDFLRAIARFLDLAEEGPGSDVTPLVNVTKPPRLFRWTRDRPWLSEFLKTKLGVELTQLAGYSVRDAEVLG